MINEKLLNKIKNKKILVTGHTGFKGSWLVDILSRFTSHICGFALNPDANKNNLYSLLSIKSKLEIEYIADISQYGKINDCIREFDPDIIFHLAAQPIVRESYKNPINTFTTNVIGTLNLLESVRKNILKKCAIVCITTDKVYKNNENSIPFNENDQLGGYDPYSSSKAAMEIVVDSYRKSFFNPNEYGKSHNIQLTTCRAGNVIGGGDFANDRIIVDIAIAINNNEKVVLRNPSSTRPWQHVLEPLFGYIELACRMQDKNFLKYAIGWNFGPEQDQQKPVEYITKKAIECFGKGEYIIKKDSKNPHEAGCLQLDVNKAKSNLDWKPRYTVDEAIEKTIQWYKAFFNDEDYIAIIEQQIDDYLNN